MIRVVSWNVLADAYIRREYYAATPPEVFQRARRRTAICDRLEELAHSEVICLQECDAALFGALERRLSGSAGRLFRKRGRGEGCAIFVRHALTSEPQWRELVFSDLSGHVALGVSFAGITVVTTHLKWQPGHVPDEEHCGRRQLAEILEAWPSGARVVCGDFNADPTSGVVALAASRGFEDAHAKMTDSYTCLADGQRKRIDFIFHTNDFGSTPAPLPPATDEALLPSDEQPSDHLLVEARLVR